MTQFGSSRANRWLWADRAANVAIGVLAVVFIVRSVESYVRKHRLTHDVSVPAGSAVKLGDVDWASNGLTVVLALSTDCHFCSENAPLYRQVVSSLRLEAVGKSVAIFPQASPQSRAYLAALSIDPDQVFQNTPLSVGAKVTPTVLLVDREGRVVKSWIGRLSEEQGHSVLQTIASVANRNRAKAFSTHGAR